MQIAVGTTYFALIDEQDHALVSAYKWYANPGRSGIIYAATHAKSAKGWGTLYMHRLILDAPPEKQVDHRNRNGLDNRRANLRLCSRSQNGANLKVIRSKTGFKGVTFWAGKYKTVIKVRGRNHYIDKFATAEEAANAYDAAAIFFFGEFARTNAQIAEMRGVICARKRAGE